MTTKVQKWGNSYAVRLPKAMVDALAIKKDTQVEITADGKSISIKPMHKKITLKKMLAGITARNIHTAVDWGKPVGNEIW